jgi:hypothetical protein
VKVSPVPGYQLVDHAGKPHSSGVVDMDDAEAAEAIRNGWATDATETKSKAQKPSPNKARQSSENK